MIGLFDIVDALDLEVVGAVSGWGEAQQSGDVEQDFG
jgi:hypothetical protein